MYFRLKLFLTSSSKKDLVYLKCWNGTIQRGNKASKVVCPFEVRSSKQRRCGNKFKLLLYNLLHENHECFPVLFGHLLLSENVKSLINILHDANLENDSICKFVK